MSWLVLILLVLGGAREPDARYDRACERLARATGGHVTCVLLGAPAPRTPPPPPSPLRPSPTTVPTDPPVGISNGF
jgi:hypothetical protein